MRTPCCGFEVEESGQGQDVASPRELPEGAPHCPRSLVAAEESNLRLLASRRNVSCFKPLSVYNLIQQPEELTQW